LPALAGNDCRWAAISNSEIEENMIAKTVTLSRADSEWLPRIGDGDAYVFRYAIVESEHLGKPEEKSHTQEQSV
jgi:hypothetical protein